MRGRRAARTPHGRAHGAAAKPLRPVRCRWVPPRGRCVGSSCSRRRRLVLLAAGASRGGRWVRAGAIARPVLGARGVERPVLLLGACRAGGSAPEHARECVTGRNLVHLAGAASRTSSASRTHPCCSRTTSSTPSSSPRTSAATARSPTSWASGRRPCGARERPWREVRTTTGARRCCRAYPAGVRPRAIELAVDAIARCRGRASSRWRRCCSRYRRSVDGQCGHTAAPGRRSRGGQPVRRGPGRSGSWDEALAAAASSATRSLPQGARASGQSGRRRGLGLRDERELGDASHHSAAAPGGVLRGERQPADVRQASSRRRRPAATCASGAARRRPAGSSAGTCRVLEPDRHVVRPQGLCSARSTRRWPPLLGARGRPRARRRGARRCRRDVKLRRLRSRRSRSTRCS